VRFRQRAIPPGDATAEAGVEQSGSEGAEAGFDVAEAFAEGELGEGEGEEPIVAGEVAESTIAVVAFRAVVETVAREEVEELSENGGSGEHRRVSRLGWESAEAEVSPTKLSRVQ